MTAIIKTIKGVKKMKTILKIIVLMVAANAFAFLAVSFIQGQWTYKLYEYGEADRFFLLIFELLALRFCIADAQ